MLVAPASYEGNGMDNQHVIIACSHCKTRNRVPSARLKERPVCGKCKRPLPPPARIQHPVNVTDRTFQNEVLNQSGVVLMDCWAAWCGPCQMVAPIMDQIAKEFAGQVKVAKLNIDQNPLTASRFHVLSVPTLLFFKNGQVVQNLAGAYGKPEIVRPIQ